MYVILAGMRVIHMVLMILSVNANVYSLGGFTAVGVQQTGSQ